MIIYITEATTPAVTLGAIGISTPSVSVTLAEPPEYILDTSIWSDREYYTDEENYTD